MTYRPVLLGLAALLAWTSGAAIANAPQKAKAPHLELDLTGVEYRRLNADGALSLTDAADPLAAVLTIGKRNLDWLDLLNAHRGADAQLQLSTPELTQATPITAPHAYNRPLILARFAQRLAALSAANRAVWVGTEPLPTSYDGDEATFLQQAREIDSSYQEASRWLALEPYLDGLAEESVKDVRGYYYLTREPELEAELTGWATLPAPDQARLTPLLVGLCHNSMASLESCRAELLAAAADSKVVAFYHSYLPASASLWQSFFVVQRLRPNVRWSKQTPDLMQVPFLDPGLPVVVDWLKTNVEDEWRYGSWQLRLAFQGGSERDIPRLVFSPGSTPHVNGIGGDVITMDANRNLQEYVSRWAIRHEYGHVLGFPDCYVEYYDAAAAQIINYQLDTTNLMCSRRGHLLKLHYDELKQAYLRD